MGIKVRIETESARCVQQLVDPQGYLSWLLSFAPRETTACLRFIDPYGNAMFNGLQLPVLRAELEQLSGHVTPANLEFAKTNYLQQTSAWPQRAVHGAKEDVDRLSLDVLEEHLQLLMALVDAAIELGPHHYVRFVGD